ncbi:anaerobic C4-dicarboxylate transporter [Desulfovibrio sp. UCD-KL4C]|uniref:anaerobic C4-dicarboxylate transporter n=1 Tax=Desulfovibrio sp. UCD-KL4C TaxID=2578120 RepID=UPI0025BC9388|nr:anaerobic C4-dicarboxylate transporter [Desulfovibrio sp. UCD-KL4C]
MFWIHLLVLLAIIFIGIRYGGVAFGLLGGLGVSILVFVFGIKPGHPPISVMLIIISVVAASATLEATGGLSLLVKFAEKILRKHPENIVYLGPICTFSLTVLVGTGHSVYPLLPVIYDVAYKNGIRPERALAVSSVAAQMGITASPIAAAAAVVLATATSNNVDINLVNVLMVTIPSTFLGMLTSATWSLKRGKDLDKDEEFQEKIKNPDFLREVEGENSDSSSQKIAFTAKKGLTVFLLGIFAVIILALLNKHLLPKGVTMSVAIQFMMLSVGAIILLMTNISPKTIVHSSVFTAGMTAVITIFGIAWMSDTIINYNEPYLIGLISEIVHLHPWTFAIAMFFVSMFLKSQAAVLTIMLPLGFSLGIPKEVLIGVLPSCYAYFFFPFYPSDLAAISFDRTGTTHIGKYVLNHSFMFPGLIGVGTATVIGYFLAQIVF